jgi:NAD(P)-dependent dehydrogenase (short-subunit alcohol dehydrogenase family)
VQLNWELLRLKKLLISDVQKVILITGISSGFGKAISEKLSEEDYRIYGISRKPAEIGGINIINADVTDKSSINAAIGGIIEKEQRIDVLINNAGMGIAGPVESFSPEDIQLQVGTNFNGVINTIQAVLSVMRVRKSGMIINISSIGGVMGLPFQGFYSASKFAVEGMSESLRMELRPYRIKVVVIRPGDFFTNFTSNRKMAGGMTEANPYRDQFNRTLSIIEKDENGGLKPDYLAKKISSIIESKNPHHQYTIATAEQKLAVILKKLLPDSWFSSMLQSHYGIK